MAETNNTNELYSLIIQAIEGNISEDDFLSLQERISKSDSDCDAYAEAIIISSMLNKNSHLFSSFIIEQDTAEKPQDSQFGLQESASDDSPVRFDSNTSLRGVDLSGLKLDADAEESEDSELTQAMLELLELERTSPAVEIPKEEPKRELIQKVERDFKWFPGRPSKHKTRTLLAMVASVMAAIGYLYFFAPENIDRPVVASLGDSIDAVWDSELQSPDEFGYMVQSRYGLKKGYASILFNDGARVTVEAPAEISLNSSGDMQLFKGKIYAVVPDRAKGFSVKAAKSKIVDLGTEFGVEVDNTGNAQLHVTKGKTLLFADLFKGRSSSVNVDAGAAKKIYNDGFVKDIEIIEDKFVTRINSKTGLVHKGRSNEIVYEPFDYADGRLQDVSDWTRVRGSSTVQTPGLSYGTLPVSGGCRTGNGGYTLNSAAADLAAAGLLADGRTLWMSALFSPLTQSNANLVVNLGTDYVNEWSAIDGGTGDSLGFTVQAGDVLQARYFLDGTLFRPSNIAGDIPIGTTVMIVIEMVWNADPAQPDTINYYLPDADLNIGSIRKTIDTAAFDQASFDTFGIAGTTDSALLDEIRFGKSYLDVIGGIETE